MTILNHLSDLSTLDRSDLVDIIRVLSHRDRTILTDLPILSESTRDRTFHKYINGSEEKLLSSALPSPPVPLLSDAEYDECRIAPGKGRSAPAEEDSVAGIFPSPPPSLSHRDEPSAPSAPVAYVDDALIDNALADLSHKELIELIKRIMVAQRLSMDSLSFDTITDRSVTVEKRGRSTSLFRDDFVYGLYLRNPHDDGMSPLRFIHRWSYGIYIMALIDRINNPHRAGSLSLKRNREPFISLYCLLFGLPASEGQNVFEKLITRSILTPGGQTRDRAGRLNDCRRDVNDTLISILGEYESIPFKIRSDNRINLSPDKISLPHELLSIRFV